jgi:hypothetical protein
MTTPPPSLRYPIKKLTSKDDYVQIDIYQYKPGGLISGSSFSLPSGGSQPGTLEQSIILPMPQSLPDNSTSAMWGKNEMGPLEISAANIAKETIDAGNAFEGLYNSIGQEAGKFMDAAQTGIGQGALSSGIAAAAVKNILGQGGDVGSYLSRSGGITFNQNVELLFTGVDLRPAFAFNFDMVPRSQKESDTIKTIIKVLKKAMTASKGTTGSGAGLFITAPRVFNVKYKSGSSDHPFLNQFKTCALQSMSVNFTPDGTYTTYGDATPVHMQLTLQFQELTPIFREDYDTTEGQIGVGY